MVAAPMIYQILDATHHLDSYNLHKILGSIKDKQVAGNNNS